MLRGSFVGLTLRRWFVSDARAPRRGILTAFANALSRPKADEIVGAVETTPLLGLFVITDFILGIVHARFLILVAPLP